MAVLTHPLRVVDSTDVDAVLAGLRGALDGGDAILPHEGRPEVPAEVDERVALVVETSGSTGRPKRVALSADALRASASASESQLGGPGQWLLALPAHYIAGLNVLVRSIVSGTEPAVMAPGPFTAEGFVRAASGLGARLRFTSLVPVQLARLMDEDAALDVLRRFDRILVGGQATPTGLLARGLELGLNLTRTYGSSETSGGCVWDGRPIGDTSMRVRDGRVELTGSTLAEGYLGDPERTADTFTDGWYRTDDAGTIVDGTLTITGRADDVIVSGGVKVSLGEVEAAVRALPGLESAVVVAAADGQWGQVPVVVTERRVALADVRTAVARVLGRAAAPARVVVVPGIPMLASGKPDRLGIAADLAAIPDK